MIKFCFIAVMLAVLGYGLYEAYQYMSPLGLYERVYTQEHPNGTVEVINTGIDMLKAPLVYVAFGIGFVCCAFLQSLFRTLACMAANTDKDLEIKKYKKQAETAWDDAKLALLEDRQSLEEQYKNLKTQIEDHNTKITEENAVLRKNKTQLNEFKDAVNTRLETIKARESNLADEIKAFRDKSEKDKASFVRLQCQRDKHKIRIEELENQVERLENELFDLSRFQV